MSTYEAIVSRLPRASGPAADGGAVMIMLGPVAFGIPASAYARLRRRAEWRWPAQIRTGRRPAYQTHDHVAPRFNEALAILPGKGTRPRRPRSRRLRCFNEAPAILPGKGTEAALSVARGNGLQ